VTSAQVRLGLTLGGSVLLAGGGNLLLRYGMRDASVADRGVGPLVQAALSAPVAVGLVAYAASFLLWLMVLSRARLGAAFPLYIAATFVVVMFGAGLVLGEALTATRLGGAALVASGVALSEWHRPAAPGPGKP
jgi:multidrug transporter EmrE-like cation transporter